ncbi:hypothetical protein [Pseudomonas sp. DP-17]|uniref:hypothetical protein n=1 Tax=Pseudomonas sp. DP-17 TaxID=1580486 RepID=UPI001EFC0F69|nr:hypothetical protein [Pseudomonas sp. DP-17]MCG8907715.1 hypothetical protein [Pseudomonas sp. DP-17]
MILSARPLVADPGKLRLWVGAFGLPNAPAQLPLPIFLCGASQLLPRPADRWFAVRDRQTGKNGRPLNYQGVFELDSPAPSEVVEITVRLLDAQSTARFRSMPATVSSWPGGGFTLLLSSCYYQDTDDGVFDGLAGRLLQRPDLVLLVGDQVYMDFPQLEDVPSSQPAISKFFAEKYAKHFLSREFGGRGLHSLLQLAPTACIPDDHELWNNFPEPSYLMLGTHSATQYQLLSTAARETYEDFQLGGGQRTADGAQRFVVDPLHFLLLDARFDRDRETSARYSLFTQRSEQDLLDWSHDLLQAHWAGNTAIGVLALGQILFDQPLGFIDSALDKNLYSYSQFQVLLTVIRTLATAGVPVLYLSGDVHYSRVAKARYISTAHDCLFEVISSPSSLLRYLSSSPKRPPDTLDSKRFETVDDSYLDSGNMVSTLTFVRAGDSVDVSVINYSLERGRRSGRTAPVTFRMTPRR